VNGDVHERARQLSDRERVEGISAEESAWLAEHLQSCAECSSFAEQTVAALRALRSTPLELPAGLAERTQFRVALRAQQLRKGEPRRVALWTAAVLSWMTGVVTAPYVWRAFAWLGEQGGLPKLVWETGFVLWWTVPALVAGAVLLAEHEKHGGEGFWLRRTQ
jgi:hypothetical protein